MNSIIIRSNSSKLARSTRLFQYYNSTIHVDFHIECVKTEARTRHLNGKCKLHVTGYNSETFAQEVKVSRDTYVHRLQNSHLVSCHATYTPLVMHVHQDIRVSLITCEWDCSVKISQFYTGKQFLHCNSYYLYFIPFTVYIYWYLFYNHHVRNILSEG